MALFGRHADFMEQPAGKSFDRAGLFSYLAPSAPNFAQWPIFCHDRSGVSASHRKLCQCLSSIRRGTWITPEIIEGFCAFHEAGFAHSVEVWREGKLVGGLYGEAIGSYFAGESKFHLETDASKVALAWLVRHLQTLKFTLIDVQVANSHTEQFNLHIVPQKEFHRRLAEAVRREDIRFSREITWKKEDF